MSTPFLAALLRQAQAVTGQSDAVLLERFVRSHDASAFEALVERYARLVWSVCRRVLADVHDCEDVFQAAFLVLARKAPSLDGRASLAGWLHTVSLRLALKAKTRRRQAAAAIEQIPPPSFRDPLAELTGRELLCALDDDVRNLPEALREAVVLCCLEGLSRDEAAARAGCTLAAIKARLERGRELLRRRLSARGLELPAALLAAGLIVPPAPAALQESAVHLLDRPIPLPVQALTEAAFSTSFRKLTIALTLLGAAALGAGFSFSGQSQPAESPARKATEPTAALPVTAQRVDLAGDLLPDQVLMRFGTTRLRQGFTVYRLAFSPDGATVAAAGGGGRPLGLWDVATGKELRQFGRGTHQPSAVAMSPDGSLVTEADTIVRVWKTKTGELAAELKGHTNSVRAAIFSPDGSMLATGAHDATIRIWDTKTWKETRRLDGHNDSVLALAWSDDGTLLASGGVDKVIRLWDPITWTVQRELKGHETYISCLAFAKGGKALASATDAEGLIRLWDPATGKLQRLIGEGKELRSINTIAFSPDGKTLASGNGDATIRIWDPATGEELRRWKPYATGLSALVFAPDGATLATAGSWDSAIRFWDPATGQEKHPSPFGHRGIVHQMWLSPDGRTLTTLGHDQRLIRWDVAAGTGAERRFHPPDFFFGYAVASPDGKRLVGSLYKEKSAIVWDIEAGRKVDRLPAGKERPPIGKAFSPDGRTVALGTDVGTVLLWRPGTKEKPVELKGHTDEVGAVVFTPDGSRLVSATCAAQGLAASEIRVWDVPAAKSIREFKGPGSFPGLTVSPDGKLVVSTSMFSKQILVHELESGRLIRTLSTPRGGGACAFSPDGRWLATGGYEPDYSIRVWEVATAERIPLLIGHTGTVQTFIFAHDGRSLYSGASDSTVLRWDLTGRNARKPTPLAPDQAEELWEVLSQDIVKAHRAIWELVDSPEVSLPLIRKRLPPPRPVDAERFASLVAALESDSFRERQKAEGALKALGHGAEPPLRKALASAKNPEVGRRLQAVLDHLNESREWTRMTRTIAVLEYMGTNEARAALKEVADGVAEAKLTAEARAALKRLGQR
jgi:RNA polymerase sigma factor (sigma-70 family)